MAGSILVLCTGNICRSPMAQAVLARELGDAWHVESAGIGALVGEGMDEKAAVALAAVGLELPEHRARQVDAEMLRSAALVLTMEARQKDALERSYPWIKGRAFRLGHWDGMDVDDPYRRSQEIFDHTLRVIEDCVRSWSVKLAGMVLA